MFDWIVYHKLLRKYSFECQSKLLFYFQIIHSKREIENKTSIIISDNTPTSDDLWDEFEREALGEDSNSVVPNAKTQNNAETQDTADSLPSSEARARA